MVTEISINSVLEPQPPPAQVSTVRVLDVRSPTLNSGRAPAGMDTGSEYRSRTMSTNPFSVPVASAVPAATITGSAPSVADAKLCATASLA